MALDMILQGAGALMNIASGIGKYKAMGKLADKAQTQRIEESRQLEGLKKSTLESLQGLSTYKADTSGFDALQKQAALATRKAGGAPMAGQVYAEGQVAKGFADFARQAQQASTGGAAGLQASLLAGLQGTQQNLAGMEAQFAGQRQQQLDAKQAAEMSIGLTAEQARQQGRMQEYQSELNKQMLIADTAQQFGQQQFAQTQAQNQRALEIMKGKSDALWGGIVGGMASALGTTGSALAAKNAADQRMNALKMTLASQEKLGMMNRGAALNTEFAKAGGLSGGQNLLGNIFGGGFNITPTMSQSPSIISMNGEQWQLPTR